MANSLPYYISLTDVPLSAISASWYYPAAATSGNFLLNSTGNIQTTLNNSGQNFSALLTYDKYSTSTNSGAVKLLCGSNWTFGIDGSNFLFVRSSGEAYTFEDINLGRKNCLALSKNQNGFSVTKYNVPSQTIENSQTHYFSPNANLTGTGLIFAGGNSISGVKNFYGTVDQLAVFNQPLSENSLNTIFSGFLSQTLTSGTPVTGYSLSSAYWEGTTGISQANLNFLQSGAVGYAYYANISNHSGNHYGNLAIATTGNRPATYFINTGAFSGIPGCPIYAGASIGSSGIGSYTGLVSSPITGVTELYKSSAESYYSFHFTGVSPGAHLTLSYNKVITQSVSIPQNTGYYLGFEMSGIVSKNSNSVMLGKFNTSFKNVNDIGVYDIVSNDYYAPGAITNDRVFLDGLGKTGYYVSGQKVGFTGLTLTEQNKLIYDQVYQSGLILQMFNVKNFATGKFYPKTAVAFSGDQSFVQMWRITEPNFIETHPYHLYHGKEIPRLPENYIYENTNTHWQ